MTTFKEAADLLCMSAAELGEAFGRSAQHIRQSRLDPSHANYRPPPEGWRPVLAKLAAERARALDALADELRKAPNP
jgi:hypothetical protein